MYEMFYYVLQSPIKALSSAGTEIIYSLLIPMRAVSVRTSIQLPLSTGPACIQIQYTGCPAES